MASLGVATGQELTEAPRFSAATSAESEPVEASVRADRPVDPQPDEQQDDRAELVGLLRKAHGWARFEPGAWRRLRTVSEAFDASGATAGRSVTERLERLVDKDRNSYTLAIESVVSLAGLRKAEPGERQRLAILTDRPLDLGETTVTRGESTSVSLGGMSLPCRLWNVEQTTANGGETDVLYLSEDRNPLILRRERQATAQGRQSTQLVQSVVRLETPALYGDQITPTWHRTTLVTKPDGSHSESFSIHSDRAPGGLHSETVTEYDASGRRLRWAVTHLAAAAEASDLSLEVPGELPAISIEVRPRRFLRMLRRDERRSPDG